MTDFEISTKQFPKPKTKAPLKGKAKAAAIESQLARIEAHFVTNVSLEAMEMSKGTMNQLCYARLGLFYTRMATLTEASALEQIEWARNERQAERPAFVRRPVETDDDGNVIPENRWGETPVPLKATPAPAPIITPEHVAAQLALFAA